MTANPIFFLNPTSACIQECGAIVAPATQAYARQAQDGELIGYVTEIRLRAERRAGEMLQQNGREGRARSGRSGPN